MARSRTIAHRFWSVFPYRTPQEKSEIAKVRERERVHCNFRSPPLPLHSSRIHVSPLTRYKLQTPNLTASFFLCTCIVSVSKITAAARLGPTSHSIDQPSLSRPHPNESGPVRKMNQVEKRTFGGETTLTLEVIEIPSQIRQNHNMFHSALKNEWGEWTVITFGEFVQKMISINRQIPGDPRISAFISHGGKTSLNEVGDKVCRNTTITLQNCYRIPTTVILRWPYSTLSYSLPASFVPYATYSLETLYLIRMVSQCPDSHDFFSAVCSGLIP